MKKLLWISLLVLLTFTLITGCGNNDSSDNASNKDKATGDEWKEWQGEITIWDGPRWADANDNKYHWLEQKVAEFKEIYPGVTVKIIQTPWNEKNEKLSVAIAGRAWPDISAMDISEGAVNLNHVEQGVLESLNEFLTEEELKDFYQNGLDAYTVDGNLYGIPNSLTVHAMLLNLDIFEEKGVEPPTDGKWSYDEFVETAKALTGDNVHGFSTYLLPGYYEAWPFIMMDGGQPLSEDLTEYTFDSPEAISGLQKFVDLKFKHGVAPQEMGGADVGGTWKAWAAADQRTVAMQPWATWAIAAAGTENWQTNFMVAEYPTGETGESVTIGGAGGWVMFKQTDANKKRMVAEFMKYISSTEEQYTMAKNYGVFPALQSAAEMDPYADNPQMAAAQELSSQAVMLPHHQKWGQIDEAIQKELQLAANGEKTPEEALKAARKSVENIIK